MVTQKQIEEMRSFCSLFISGSNADKSNKVIILIVSTIATETQETSDNTPHSIPLQWFLFNFLYTIINIALSQRILEPLTNFTQTRNRTIHERKNQNLKKLQIMRGLLLLLAAPLIRCEVN